MNDLVSVVKSLGVKELSARVYVAGLGLGPTTIESLSEKSGIKRTTIYGLMDELVKFGLVTIFKNNKKRTYQMEDPRHLERVCEDVVEGVKKTMGSFLSLWNTPNDGPRLNYVEGKLNFLKFIESIEKGDCEFYHIAGTVNDLNRTLGHNKVSDFVKRKDAKNIKRKILVPKEPWVYDFIKKNPSDMREVRFLPEGAMAPVQIYLYDHSKCAFITMDERIRILTLDDEAVYRMQKTMFEVLWSQSIEVSPSRR